ncbi:MAG: hypothetical protein ABIP75_12135 [Pyrinomonadaceae bacterium]
MLEILALIHLTRRIGEIVAEKGRKTFGYKLMAVALWIGGEFVSAVLGAVIAQVMGWPSAIAYLFALIGAVIGAGIAFLIAKQLPPLAVEPPPQPPSFS